jgi:hypothetical protein
MTPTLMPQMCISTNYVLSKILRADKFENLENKVDCKDLKKP